MIHSPMSHVYLTVLKCLMLCNISDLMTRETLQLLGEAPHLETSTDSDADWFHSVMHHFSFDNSLTSTTSLEGLNTGSASNRQKRLCSVGQG